jgi:hypothetical protein
MRNWTRGYGEPLAVRPYITGVISWFALKKWKQLTFDLADCFVLRILSVSVFHTIHHQSVIV